MRLSKQKSKFNIEKSSTQSQEDHDFDLVFEIPYSLFHDIFEAIYNTEI